MRLDALSFGRIRKMLPLVETARFHFSIFVFSAMVLLLGFGACTGDEPTAIPPTATSIVGQKVDTATVEATSDSAPRVVTVAPEITRRLAVPNTDSLATTSPEVLPTTSVDPELLATSPSTATADPFSEPAVEIISDGPAVEIISDGPTVNDGGVLRVPFNGGLVPDPAFHDGVGANRPLLAELFSGLTRLSRIDGVAELDLAESYTIDSQGTRYEFVLRKDLRFSDGTPVRAADFKWSWERALDPTFDNSAAKRVFENVVGIDSVLSGESQDMEGVEVIDDLTLRVTLETPRYDFMNLLADPVASVLRQGNVENWIIDWRSRFNGESYIAGTEPEEGSLAAGTGPFKLAEFDLYDQILVLDRNEHYWDTPAHVDRVEYIGPAAYSDGEVILDYELLFENLIIDLHRAIPQFVASIGDGPVDGRGAVRSLAVPPTVDFLAFNSGADPLRDLDFRRALVIASPVHELMPEGGLSMNGSEVVIASSLLPPNFPGHVDEPFMNGFNLDEAASNLAVEQRSLVFHTYVGGAAIDQFETLAASWGTHLDVETEVKEVSLDKFDAWLRNGDVEIRRVIVTPHYADPSSVLGVMDGLFGDRAESPESQEISRRLAEAQREADAALRLEHFHELEHYLFDNALVLPLFWTSDQQWVRLQPWILEYSPPKYHGSRFKSVRIDVNHPEYPADER